VPASGGLINDHDGQSPQFFFLLPGFFCPYLPVAQAANKKQAINSSKNN